MFNWSGRTFTTQRILPDDTVPIDNILDEPVVEKIYRNWDEDMYGNLIDYGGGVRAITAMMVRDAGVEFLMSISGIGPKRADTILQAVSEAVQEVPYI